MSTTTSTLNDLIEILKDGQQGFTEAARDIGNGDLKAVLSGFATQREQFATQLQVVARNFGEDAPAKSGSVTGAVHRGWINLKAAIASRNDHAILEECERGEDAAVAAYQESSRRGRVARECGRCATQAIRGGAGRTRPGQDVAGFSGGGEVAICLHDRPAANEPGFGQKKKYVNLRSVKDVRSVPNAAPTLRDLVFFRLPGLHPQGGWVPRRAVIYLDCGCLGICPPQKGGSAGASRSPQPVWRCDDGNDHLIHFPKTSGAPIRLFASTRPN